ncbi:hypothetical protein ALQ36_02110 [Pseudomonas syringae pv. primulae]|uniref:YD repeat protein n=2 Tax=Pseudomonas syringae group genomosp. 3 TaxID=251701 RepID=A0A3M5TX22_9PSED|nr:hypothetical protein ALQ36_02110 [Pseudomonas syringae pv. primulae]RMU37498.1 YD repeat protein [Pseudomonas syringae pv. primulae]
MESLVMASSNQAVLCRYSYDPLDRLASSSPVGQADLQRFDQQNRLETEIQGALRRTVFQHEDLLLAQQRRVDGVLETTLLATDQQRSVLQLVDKAGTEPIAYSPYGHHPAESGLTSLLGFNGERRDPVTGHYLLGNGYRAYNPVLMRFNSLDSLSPFGEGGLNAYGYVGGDPVGFGDETGHVPVFKPFFMRSSPYHRRDILSDYIITVTSSRNRALVGSQAGGARDGIYSSTTSLGSSSGAASEQAINPSATKPIASTSKAASSSFSTTTARLVATMEKKAAPVPFYTQNEALKVLYNDYRVASKAASSAYGSGFPSPEYHRLAGEAYLKEGVYLRSKLAHIELLGIDGIHKATYSNLKSKIKRLWVYQDPDIFPNLSKVGDIRK